MEKGKSVCNEMIEAIFQENSTKLNIQKGTWVFENLKSDFPKDFSIKLKLIFLISCITKQ